MLELEKGRINFVCAGSVLDQFDRSDRLERWFPVTKSRTGLTGLFDRSDWSVADIWFKCFNLQD